MNKLLVVIDYQKDFVDGALGFKKAETLEQGIYDKVKEYLKMAIKFCSLMILILKII
ncbi:nicotinamidase-related amidase [Clostridium beijerinckii]|nr:nicotinamidase-related amidase [Clostridium beijerinckii]